MRALQPSRVGRPPHRPPPLRTLTRRAPELLQRALRVNRTSRSLWVEYLRMELLYIARLVGRRMVLGLYQEDEAKRRRMRIDLGKVGGDGEAEAADADAELKEELEDLERRRAIIAGAIPNVVLRNALQGARRPPALGCARATPPPPCLCWHSDPGRPPVPDGPVGGVRRRAAGRHTRPRDAGPQAAQG